MNNKDIILVPLLLVFLVFFLFFEAVPVSKKYLQTQQYSSYLTVTQFADNVVGINLVNIRRKFKNCLKIISIWNTAQLKTIETQYSGSQSIYMPQIQRLI